MVVLGVSPDPVESHKAFKEKYDLPFTLLADPEHLSLKRYGVWQMKNVFGKQVEGVVRTTYVIDVEGNVQHVFENVKPDGHSKGVLDFLDRRQDD